jgi:hypothetical protein
MTKTDQNTHHYEVPLEDWYRVRQQAYDMIEYAAHKQQMISYTELVAELDHITDPHSRALALILGQIQEQCHNEDKGLLPAIVVFKNDPTNVGLGFFRMAKELGYQFSDTPHGRDVFWLDQVRQVFADHR